VISLHNSISDKCDMGENDPSTGHVHNIIDPFLVYVEGNLILAFVNQIRWKQVSVETSIVTTEYPRETDKLLFGGIYPIIFLEYPMVFQI